MANTPAAKQPHPKTLLTPKTRDERKTFGFDPEVAEKYGAEGAMFMHRLVLLLNLNYKNGQVRHFHNGCVWTFNSYPEIAVQCPWWTERQLGRIVRRLRKKGAIVTGCFNAKGYDKTMWYTILDEWIIEEFLDFNQKYERDPAEMTEEEGWRAVFEA